MTTISFIPTMRPKDAKCIVLDFDDFEAYNNDGEIAMSEAFINEMEELKYDMRRDAMRCDVDLDEDVESWKAVMVGYFVEEANRSANKYNTTDTFVGLIKCLMRLLTGDMDMLEALRMYGHYRFVSELNADSCYSDDVMVMRSENTQKVTILGDEYVVAMT